MYMGMGGRDSRDYLRMRRNLGSVVRPLKGPEGTYE